MKKFVALRRKFIAGRLCLDFVNSVYGRLERRVGNSHVFTIFADKLNRYDDLVCWAREAGIFGEKDEKRLIYLSSQNQQKSERVFERAIVLRESLFRVFKHVPEGWTPPLSAVKRLNRECAIARMRQKLAYSSNKFEWRLESEESDLDRVIWPVALSSTDLLASADLSRFRQCPGFNCGWLFLDTGKNRSRRWCNMKDCGNLSKVRRYCQRLP